MVRRGAALLFAGGLAGCDLGSSTIPLADPQIVVHAVLNPSLNQQVVLLEESLTGKKPPDALFFVSDNPIATGRGIAIAGALVQLEDETGAVYTATERRIGTAPTGIYIVPIVAQGGMRYRLTVQALGKTVTASTVVPVAAPAAAAVVVPFNRDHDSAKVSMPEVGFARGYFLRVDAPFSAFSVVTTDRDVSITGDTRNLFTENLLRVFFPGFEQTLTVAAVDTNLYDYYRSGSDPFSGVGLINRVQGGLGVFGSIAVLERRVLDVTQDFSGHPLEDTFTLRGTAPPDVPHALRFYRESAAETPESQDRLTGYYLSGPVDNPVRGPLVATIAVVGGSYDIQMLQPRTTAESAGGFIAYFAAADYRINPGADTVKAYFGSVQGVLNYVRQGK
jgi:hypothetical protein